MYFISCNIFKAMYYKCGIAALKDSKYFANHCKMNDAKIFHLEIKHGQKQENKRHILAEILFKKIK